MLADDRFRRSSVSRWTTRSPSAGPGEASVRLPRGNGSFVSWRRAYPRHIQGIGAFAVKFRWVVIAAWLIAGFAVPKFLPSLSSVTQGNNSAFLPADAPSEQAAQLAAPFGSTNLIPVPVVAAASQGTLTAADVTWLTGL